MSFIKTKSFLGYTWILDENASVVPDFPNIPVPSEKIIISRAYFLHMMTTSIIIEFEKGSIESGLADAFSSLMNSLLDNQFGHLNDYELSTQDFIVSHDIFPDDIYTIITLKKNDIVFIFADICEKKQLYGTQSSLTPDPRVLEFGIVQSDGSIFRLK